MNRILILILSLLPLTMSAQKKQFTLDDLIPGGKTYNSLRPEARPYHFDGDQLVDGAAPRKEKTKPDAFVKNHDLFVLLADGTEHRVTTDGSSDIVYGEAVHRNEFGIEEGLFWSADKSRLAFYRMDQSMVSDYPQVNITPNADSQCYTAKETASRCATLEPDAYPMAGETSHQVTVGIFDRNTRQTIYLDCGDPTDRYFTNIAWSPDGSKLYLIEVNRDQNHGSLDEYDAVTGKKLRTLFTEDNPKYFEPMHPIQFLPWDSSRFIYQTRRDGYNHIYLYNISGKLERQLTTGKFEVINMLGFCPSLKSIIYTSNEAHPLSQTIYSVNTSGKRTAMGSTEGWHSSATLSASGTYIIDRYSTPTCPLIIDHISVKSGKARTLHTAKSKWEEQGFDVPEMHLGTLKAADGVTDLYYRLIQPTGFDPNKKYPAVVYVYGGPHAHNVDNSYNYGVRGWDIYMAQRGYVMFCIDNRGSEHRGLDFEQATFRKLGTEEMLDQLCGVEYLKSLPYVDAERMGVHGWSFGGFMTSSLLCSFDGDDVPDGGYIPAPNGMFHGKCPFKVGVAGGPVIDWRFYEVMYGERYMDTPQTNPEGYDNASLLNKAKNLRDHLLVIYGGNDPTCVPQHTLSFMRACIDANTYPDLFTYPGDGHNMFGTDRIHLHEKITRYFDQYLK